MTVTSFKGGDEGSLQEVVRIQRRWVALKDERASWMDHWGQISDVITPRRGRFFVSDRNRGEKRNTDIYDSTGINALRVLGAGMMAGAMSPARPWFKLSTSDPDLDRFDPVKVWLADVTERMQRVFRMSNTYQTAHGMFEELGAFGTSASIIQSDFNNVIHHYPQTAGQYCLATNFKGEVDTIYREFEKTVAEVVNEFGLKACSGHIQNQFEQRNLDMKVNIIHAIEPRENRDPKSKLAINMPFQSLYFESDGERSHLLRESGFEYFPAITPRWSAPGGDIYGTSPGMDALGDVRQLQHQQLRKAQAIDYKTKPPLQVPVSMQNREVNMLPGGISYYDGAQPQGAIRTAFDVNLDLSHLLNDIMDVRGRINTSFFADLFLMLAGSNRNNMTATEVAERHEEKLLMLGPTIERVHHEMLEPTVEITFANMIKGGLVPPPPEDLNGKNINVEFVSMLAQAQKAVATNAIDKYVANMGQIASMKPEVLDNLDVDRWADTYAENLGVDPRLIVSDKNVALIRQQRQEAQQAAQQREQAVEEANIANQMAGSPTDSQNVLTDVIQQFSGYTTP
jgi:hypothetical protein